VPKKNMTPEEKKAWGEKMKKAREAKKQSKQIKDNPPEKEANAGLSELLKQIEEMKDNPLVQALLNNNQKQGGTQVTERGVIGTFEKYITDPKHYPDPRERLFEYFETESKFRRIGFRDNYELDFKIAAMTPYERKDGVQETQPKFTLELNRIIYDEDTYEPTNGRYTVCRYVFFEDPQTAVIVARDNGLEVQEQNEKAFLDEMRFIRMKDCLVECFYPPKQDRIKKQKKDMVINGKQVQYFEVNSEDATNIPFDQLKTKIKA
jgi:hypothetical protein